MEDVSCLEDGGVKVPLQEEGAGTAEEGDHSCCIDDDNRPESGSIAQVLGHEASDENAKSHADVP